MALKICYFSSVSSMTTGMPVCMAATIELMALHSDCSISVVLPEPGAFSEYLQLKGISVTFIPFRRLSKAQGIKSIALFLVCFFRAFIQFAGFLRKHRFDVVHFSDFIDAPFYPAAKMMRTRVISHLRMNFENTGLKIGFKIWSHFFVDHIIAVSKSVQLFADISGPQSTVIYDPGPDPLLFAPSHNPVKDGRFVINDDVIYVFANAAFREVKGHENIIKLALTCKQQTTKTIIFAIIGGKVPGHESYFSSIAHQIGISGIAEQFLLLGETPYKSISSILVHADIFIHVPCYQEGLGMVVVEAMQMEIPVVAFDSGGVKECFAHGSAGFLVPFGDIGRAAYYIVRLAEDRSLRQTMGACARKEALQKFGREHHRDEIIKLYTTVQGFQ